MNNIIYRVVGGNFHVLNISSGDLMTFDISKNDMYYLLKNWKKIKLESDVKMLFAHQGQINTRLCRSNLIDLGMDFGFPTVVNIELNRRCILRCKHCYIGEEHLESSALSVFEKMTLEDITSFFDELGNMGVFLLVFTGGEPFINKKLQHFIEMATKKNFVIEIFSNLQFIPKWFRELSPTSGSIGRIQVSVYSSNEKTHDTITNQNGSYKKTMKNLKFLMRKGFYVEVATPLMIYNYETWKETKNFFLKLGIKQDFSWPIVDEYYSQKTNKTLLNLSAKQFQKFVDENPDFLIKTDFSDVESPICEAGRAIFSVVANGDVFPCSQLPCPVGNITQKDLLSIYQSDKMQKFRNLKMLDTGLKASYNYCIGLNYSETGNILTQPKIFAGSIREILKKKGGGRREKVHPDS